MAPTTKRERQKRGQGRLYKRDGNGKEHSAQSRVHGVFWLEYRVDGKRKRQALRRPDGSPITRLKEAEEERTRRMRPFAANRKVEQLKDVRSLLSDAETDQAEAERDLVPAPALEDAWGVYLRSQSRPDSGPVTLADYERHYNKLLGWLGANHPDLHTVDQVTHDIAVGYAQFLDPVNGEGRVSPNTFNKRIGFLRLFFRVLGEEGRVEANPFERIKRRKLRTNSRRELTVEQVFTVLSSATGEMALLLGLGYFTGLRRGDCCTLLWSEVDLVRGIIKRIPNKVRGRSADPEPVKVGIAPDLHLALSQTPPKRRRGFVLPGVAKLYNDPSRRDRISRMIAAHFDTCGIKCVRPGTGRYRDPVTKEWVSTGKRAISDYGFHSLRYSYISHHAERGTPQAVIQANAGHRNPAMTEHYTRISDETARQVAATIALPKPAFGELPESATEEREPLPDWARELLATMQAGNWEEIRELLLAVT